MPVTGGPYLAAAFFCEKALTERDGVISFIRVVDQWNVRGASETMPPTVIQAMLVILMKSGIFRGSTQIVVTPTSPSGVEMPSISFPVEFRGDDQHGSGIIVPMAFPVQEPGCYWFDVAIGPTQSVTKIPLSVSYLQAGPIVAQPTVPPPRGR